jgi:hypothetical protein
MLDLIAHGTLKTDGSERHVAFTSDGQNGNLVAHPRSHLIEQPEVWKFCW